MLKGTESGLLIQIKDIEKDIKELDLKLRSKMFITRIDFFIYPQDKEHFERLESLLKGYGFKLFIAEERANRTTIRMQEKLARLESEKVQKSDESEMHTENSLSVASSKESQISDDVAIASEKLLKVDQNEHSSEQNVSTKRDEVEESTELFTFFSNFDTLTVQRNLRSGQRIEHSGNIVIIGDINSGAEVYAEGDVYVFGKIKGTVHAGKSGNQKSVIIGFSLETQMLRIGTQFLEKQQISKNSLSHYQRAYITSGGELVIEEIGK